MILPADLTALLMARFPDAAVEIFDKTGIQEHYIVVVRSSDFIAMNTLTRHRAVQDAVREALADGRLHAIEITTQVPEQVVNSTTAVH
jgi:stress-induced morphogen